MTKPGRPFGLSIAIVAGIVQFTLLPLIRWLWVWGLQQQMQVAVLEGDGSAHGGGIVGQIDTWLVVEGVLGLMFLVIAVMSWRGKPSSMRYIFAGAVLLLVLLTLVQTVVVTSRPQSIVTGIDSGAGLADTLLWLRLLVSLLLGAYTAWFVNRGPSRAFFRGYYLS